MNICIPNPTGSGDHGEKHTPVAVGWREREEGALPCAAIETVEAMTGL